ncbi:dihydrofolate reductase [Kocuria sp. M4R2S49]|uniref:dihydrofolate reductase n=1 Tax=Kocuria rhizosphaericola TaxID=3376284 RepID=UPI0037964C05
MTTPTICAIWAQSADAIIGADNAIPWHVPENLAYFKAATHGHPVIMGRRTWDSLPAAYRPLPGRTSIVLTSTPELIGPAAEVACDLDEALTIAADSPGAEQVWIIGGATLYRQAVEDPRLAEVHVTTVDLRVPGDAHVPALNGSWAAEEVVAPTRSSSGINYWIDRYARPGV